MSTEVGFQMDGTSLHAPEAGAKRANRSTTGGLGLLQLASEEDLEKPGGTARRPGSGGPPRIAGPGPAQTLPPELGVGQHSRACAYEYWQAHRCRDDQRRAACSVGSSDGSRRSGSRRGHRRARRMRLIALVAHHAHHAHHAHQAHRSPRLLRVSDPPATDGAAGAGGPTGSRRRRVDGLRIARMYVCMDESRPAVPPS